MENFVKLGGEEEGMTGNSHMHAPGGHMDGNHAAKSQENHSGGGGAAKEEPNKTKEKSVLQAKLTKLAIQIGYAGNFPTFLMLLTRFSCCRMNAVN